MERDDKQKAMRIVVQWLYVERVQAVATEQLARTQQIGLNDSTAHLLKLALIIRKSQNLQTTTEQ